MRSGPRRRDNGETLAEILVALSILGIAVTALLGGIASSTIGSDVHRKQASAEVALRAWGEAVEGAAYSGCATAPADYSASGLGIAAAYSGFTFALPVVVAQPQPPGTTNCAKLELITLQVDTVKTTATLTLVKQAP